MTETISDVPSDMSLLSLGTLMLRKWRRIGTWMFVGGLLAVASVFNRPVLFLATASIAPQGNDVSRSSLASLAGQFGVSVPSGGLTLTPEYYARLVKSPTVLRSIALDTFVVVEQGGRRVAFLDLMEIEGSGEAMRLDAGYEQLVGIVSASVSKTTGIVDVTAETEWRSVSLALVSTVLTRLDELNQQTRQSMAATERKFVEGRLALAATDLRDAEERLGLFLRTNRQLSNSSELQLNQDRLQRAVNQRQSVFTTLSQSYEEARIREVRDTPVFTVVEPPAAPSLPQPRGRAKVALLGLMLGAFFGTMVVIGSEVLVRRRASGDVETNEFISALADLRNDLLSIVRRVSGRTKTEDYH